MTLPTTIPPTTMAAVALRRPLWAAMGIHATRTLASSSRVASSAAPHTYSHEHTPLSRPHKLALTLGSALASFYNPARGDMIALLGELSGEPMLPKLREMMSSSHEGRSLLLQKPVINTTSVDMDYLESLDEATFGKQYWRWLRWCNVGPDTRAKVCISRSCQSQHYYSCCLLLLCPGPIHRRSRDGLRHATISRVPRLFPPHVLDASVTSGRDCRQDL